MKSGPSPPSQYQLVLVSLLVATLATSDAFSIVPPIHRGVAPSLVKDRSSSRGATGGDAPDGVSVPSTTAALKADLLEHIQTFRAIKERDGEISVDFGVKGGELDKKTRAPQKVDFYSISDDAGKAADAVMETAEELAKNNPTAEPTLYLGDKENGFRSPLDGEWKLLFTTAADATFSKNSTRGDARAKNVVDASRGRITNVIDFATPPNGTEPLLKQLNVVIAASAAEKARVELRNRRWSLYIPVPGPFITRLLVVFSRIIRFGRKTGKRVPPKAYFDVLYLDEQLRIHRTGEDNLFVQAKEAVWEEAKPLLA